MTSDSGVKSFKYRLYPTVAQAAELDRQLAEACRLYNAALQERRDAWRMQRKSIGLYEQCAQLRDIRAAGDIAIPSQRVAINVLRQVDHAFEGFFRRVRQGAAPGYPRFRSASRFDALSFSSGCPKRWVMGRHVMLVGVGAVKVKLHRPYDGEIKLVRVRRSAGRWYVCLVCKVPPVSLPATGQSVGIDVGLASFATLSNAETIPNPRYLERGQRHLRLAQRRVARRVKGSRSRRKAIRLLQRVHEHVGNQRRDFHHKVSHDLVKRFDLIAVEDLNVKGLASGMLARSVNDAGWAQFLRLLAYKAENAGRSMVAVDPAGTSQMCSGCGERVTKTLRDRIHACPGCGLVLDRDHNAALNILSRAGMARVASTDTDGRPVAAEAHIARSTSDSSGHDVGL